MWNNGKGLPEGYGDWIQALYTVFNIKAVAEKIIKQAVRGSKETAPFFDRQIVQPEIQPEITGIIGDGRN